jgi:hypothetical protein
MTMMTRIVRASLVALVLALVLGTALSAQNAVQFMPLTQSLQFQNRVTYQIVLAAPVIETEAAGTGGSALCHTARATLATQVMRYPASFTPVFAIALVTSSNVTTAGALTGAGPTLDTPATDAALFSATNAVWSSIAGCVTNP